jgi:hypothetical protein
VTVSYSKGPNEVVLFFEIDEQTNPSSTFRQDIAPNINEICDGLIFFENLTNCVFCFVELKGGNIDHAIDQIVSTKRAFINSLTQSIQRKSCRNKISKITLKAFIAVNASSPMKLSSKKRSLLSSEFGDQNNICISRNRDISSFLRSN